MIATIILTVFTVHLLYGAMFATTVASTPGARWLDIALCVLIWPFAFMMAKVEIPPEE